MEMTTIYEESRRDCLSRCGGCANARLTEECPVPDMIVYRIGCQGLASLGAVWQESRHLSHERPSSRKSHHRGWRGPRGLREVRDL